MLYSTLFNVASKVAGPATSAAGFLAKTYVPGFAQSAAYNLTYAALQPTSLFSRVVTNVAAHRAANMAFMAAAGNAPMVAGLAGTLAFTAAEYAIKKGYNAYFAEPEA